MRVYGTTTNETYAQFIAGVSISGGPALAGALDAGFGWVEVDAPDASGNSDALAITWLCQCLQLNTGESPFYADWGIPARQSVMQQVLPDFYCNLMQQRFASYFASLQITRTATNPPTYQVNIVTHQGVQISGPVPT